MDLYKCLRPSLGTSIKAKPCAAYSRFFVASTRLLEAKPSKGHQSIRASDFARRVQLLEDQQGPTTNWYPRIQRSRTKNAFPDEIKQASSRLSPGESAWHEGFSLKGRVLSVRAASSKLLFIDVERKSQTVQVVCDFGKLPAESEAGVNIRFRKAVRRGDWISVTGHAHKTLSSGESLYATALPRILSPSLHQIPKELSNPEMKARNPHVSMLVDPAEVQTMVMRSKIEQHLFKYLTGMGFHHVRTPILGCGAGGAVAKPFETKATELSETKLDLRIAPELWLKRLIVGGLDKVFELGPAFRNEGVDNTHNPEFTMCEYYAAFADIDTLMFWTEELLRDLFKALSDVPVSLVSHLPVSILQQTQDPTRPSFFPPDHFQRLPFIPTLEREMFRKLPDLSSSSAAYRSLTNLFLDLKLPIPAKPTVPTLLDALASRYIEPLCLEPTFVTEHPAALSPLAKSYPCPTTGHLVSARAELFIRGTEYANMYEEENSPFEQRRKFEEQLAYRRQIDPDCQGEMDESYLEALEWGLPPTGGWGMGIDRLAMLFTGRKRIGDVLPFGTLRNVVGMRKRWGLANALDK